MNEYQFSINRYLDFLERWCVLESVADSINKCLALFDSSRGNSQRMCEEIRRIVICWTDLTLSIRNKMKLN